ncbi:hypothetical protein LX36DRAFT_692715 [Colletotrichum falcatum]|nr:hypothetical protein LX36DRAFT_692715 [Colletotrichum falcatum]
MFINGYSIEDDITPHLIKNSNPSANDTPGNKHGDVPWPGRTFRIVERTSRRAIAAMGDRPVLLHPKGDDDPSTLWLCVEKDGYFGFQNPTSGSEHAIQTATHLLGWEMWTPRLHIEGGYQILSPAWEDGGWEMLVLCVAEDGEHLVRRNYGTTL